MPLRLAKANSPVASTSTMRLRPANRFWRQSAGDGCSGAGSGSPRPPVRRKWARSASALRPRSRYQRGLSGTNSRTSSSNRPGAAPTSSIGCHACRRGPGRAGQVGNEDADGDHELDGRHQRAAHARRRGLADIERPDHGRRPDAEAADGAPHQPRHERIGVRRADAADDEQDRGDEKCRAFAGPRDQRAGQQGADEPAQQHRGHGNALHEGTQGKVLGDEFERRGDDGRVVADQQARHRPDHADQEDHGRRRRCRRVLHGAAHAESGGQR